MKNEFPEVPKTSRSLHSNLMSTLISKRPRPFFRHERGVALITVLMVVALSTAISAYLIWVVNQRIELHEMHYRRLQSRLVAQTGAEWAASILLIDQQQTGGVDNLNEIWAQPLPTLPVRIRPEDPSSAIEISGSITDEQGKFNLNNLVLSQGKDREFLLSAFKKLLTSLSIKAELAVFIVDWIDADDDLTDINSAESDYYLKLNPPYRAANQPLAELSNLAKVRDMTPEILNTLAPFITFLPKHTTVNVNTTSAEVLSAMIPELSYSQALTLVEQRKTKPFDQLNTFIEFFPEEVRPRIPVALLSVRSSFFTIKSQTAQNNNFIESTALAERLPSGWPMLWWQKIQ